MLNWYLRYEPFISVLEDAGAGSVLDVGSGWYGLTWYSPRSVVQTDLHFVGGPPGGRRGEAQFVCASAESLPFASDSFDWVLSSDMIEHLPEGLRALSIVELTRVARRGVLVGFPTGQAASRVDRLVARLIRLTGRGLPGWLSEHLEQAAYPGPEVVLAALPRDWECLEQRPNGNAFVQLAVILAEMLPGLSALTRVVERRLSRGAVPAWFHRAPTVRTLFLLRPRDR